MATTSSSQALPAEAEDSYFTHNPPPSWTTLKKHVAIAREFIQRHAQACPARRVVLVTSGGTTVPLENQTVRFIDNFSAGTRGATSAEYFLRAGYAVIFLHRQFSLLPFSRHYSHNTNCFLDFLDEAPAADGQTNGDAQDSGQRVVVDQEYQSSMLRVLREYRRAKAEGALVLLPFVTITEYLWHLREIARLMRPLGSNALFYLAAAVSDFFVPRDRMAEHKIQSNQQFWNASPQAGGGGEQQVVPAAHMHDQSLVIDLDPVPKFLKQLVDGWAPEGMIVSFKLETDPAILTQKAGHALRKYSHHLVIGNLLSTRKWEVVFVSTLLPEGERWIRVPRRRRTKSSSGVARLVGAAARPTEAGQVSRDDATQDYDDAEGAEQEDLLAEDPGEPVVEIESLIIPAVRQLHDDFVAHKAASSGVFPDTKAT